MTARMEPTSERRLAAILAADVHGYSRLMERDEAGTLALLKACREAMAGHIVRHRGRVVGAAGDSLLAEFASVVNAVECAVRIQRDMAERNAALPEERRMRFRIGINVGDVVVEGDDLFGEGVNIAARLQALAEPGGILISGTVFDQVRNKLALGFDYLGPQAVKNISDAVPAWRVLLGEDAGSAGERATRTAASHFERAPGEAPPRPKIYSRLKRSAAIAAVFIAAMLAINMLASPDRLWFQWPTLGILVVLGLRAAFSLGR
jgi:adenylate cyclase